MGIRTYKIELRIDVADDVNEAMTEIIRQYARDISASATLMCNPRYQPQIMAQVDDAFYNSDEISLLEPSHRMINPDGQ
jgi:hypothetical protein